MSERTLTGMRILSEAIGLAATAWVFWRYLVPEHRKARAARHVRQSWQKLNEDEHRRHARDRLIFDLQEICGSCGCEITREIDRLSPARQR